jgi:hypothetical protein
MLLASGRPMKLNAPALFAAVVIVTSCAGDGADDDKVPVDDPESTMPPGDIVDGGDDGVALAGCNSVTTVLLYSESTFELRLPLAFADAPDPCTRYYVQLPHLNPDTTMPRPDADKVHALGPNFHALAEFSWSGWANWIAQSPGTRDFELAGKIFRKRMADAGYDVARGDSWVINEFPSSTRTGEGDARDHEKLAVKGLDEGDGTASSKGVVFLAGMGQNLMNFAVYKPNVKSWLEDSAFWNAMSAHVRWFSYEVYADPHYDCVRGSNVVADADHLNAFLEHLPRIADAGGAATAAASKYLARSYLPLVNAAWNSDNGFGNNVVSLAVFEKFSRLQIYATHLWAANHPYPGRRIGFAWAPKNSTPDQEIELAGIVARSVTRAYPPNAFYGLGKFACSIYGGLEGCGCVVAGAYNEGWQAFASF